MDGRRQLISHSRLAPPFAEALDHRRLEFGGREQQMANEFYLQARREWDERYGDLDLGKRNWQIASAGLMLRSLVLALDIVWISARAHGALARGHRIKR